VFDAVGDVEKDGDEKISWPSADHFGVGSSTSVTLHPNCCHTIQEYFNCPL
jgi:hypothetical protein